MIQFVFPPAILLYLCFFYYYYDVIRDAIEFTCIDYGDVVSDCFEEQPPIIKPKEVNYEDKYKVELDRIPKEYIVCEDAIEERCRKLGGDMKREVAKQQLISERLEMLAKSSIIEYTPAGNVLMYYNHKNGAFEYYSDATIPYRYLETVCRKYAIRNQCRPLYIDMKEELIEKKVEEKPKKPQNKVFAKLKNYNTKSLDSSKIVVLKTRSNKYLYQGKMSNYNMIRKEITAKKPLSFKDYKNKYI